jgi:dihydroflavonol-4-reductase
VALAFSTAETALAGITGREPRAPIEAVRMARTKMFVSTEKAERELGYRPGPVEDALLRAVEWFRRNRCF